MHWKHGPLIIILLSMGPGAGLWAAPSSSVHLKIPFYADTTDQCGPATLAGVLSYWGKVVAPSQLRQELYQEKIRGTLPMDLALTAEAHGLKTDMIRGDLKALQSELLAGRPLLAMVNTGFVGVPVDHYVIVTGFDDDRQGVWMHSAGSENLFMPYKKFLRQWEKADNWALKTWKP